MTTESQIKSKKRVLDHGEVFTSEREVKAMLDLVQHETERIDSRFLEPACGTGNFLIEILRRKLEVVKFRYRKSKQEFELYGTLAIASIYGVDILQDNVFQCRERLLNSFEACYVLIFDESLSSELKNSVSYILERNILWGDVLTMKTVCEKNENLIFSEWCAINGNMIKRRDYSLAHLLAHHPTDTPNLFSDLGESAFIPRPVKEYPLILYSKLHHHG